MRCGGRRTSASNHVVITTRLLPESEKLRNHAVPLHGRLHQSGPSKKSLG